MQQPSNNCATSLILNKQATPQTIKTTIRHPHNQTPPLLRVAGSGRITNPRTGDTVTEDPYYSAMKIPVPYHLKSQITNYRNQLQKTTVSSVDGKPINIEHLKSCLRQLEEKVRSTPELDTRTRTYNNYLLDTFQDSHGIYHQTILPSPTFKIDDLQITKNCYKLFRIMLTEHFKSQYDYNLHLPSTQPNERLVIIQATYPEAAYPDRELIYDKYLQKFGKLVLEH
ncbi:unnamed protein product [[Candida] boidinii]|nr:unnamed protein product [[Candida] boidinii]